MERMANVGHAGRTRATVVAVLTVFGLLYVGGVAHADEGPSSPHILRDVRLRPTPDTSRSALTWLPAGANPDYLCYLLGEQVGSTAVWFRVAFASYEGFYSSAYDDAAPDGITTTYGIPACATASEPVANARAPSAADVGRCAASLLTDAVVAARLARVLKGSGALWASARRLRSGELTLRGLESVAGVVLGTQEIVDNCQPLF